MLAFQVVRTAAVRQYPQVAAALWPRHPETMTDSVMAEIGSRSARGQALPPALLAQVNAIALKSPLAPEPFLIRGALAQLSGRNQVAERLYLEARVRDPRSRAARYFLAERYIRTGRTPQALDELAVLSRLTAGTAVFGPALAAYAQTPGAIEPLREFLRTAPEFEPIVLHSLAIDAKNTDLILALWSGRPNPPQAPQWQAAIIARLVEAGDFTRARAVWGRLSNVRPDERGLFNPDFRTLAAPPPFNWTFGRDGGLAAPASGGRLEVIYFGREDAVLAHQLLLLAPGRYQLGMEVSGDIQQGTEIAWTVDCLPSNQTVLRLPLRQGRSPAGLQASFAVPSGCRAQRLQLAGNLGEFPTATEFVIGKLALAKLTGQ